MTVWSNLYPTFVLLQKELGHLQKTIVSLIFPESKMVFCYQNCSGLAVRNNCSSDREKLMKFEAEGWEFSNFLRPLEQFIQTVKGQNNFLEQNAFLTYCWSFLRTIRTIRIQIGKKFETSKHPTYRYFQQGKCPPYTLYISIVSTVSSVSAQKLKCPGSTRLRTFIGRLSLSWKFQLKLITNSYN